MKQFPPILCLLGLLGLSSTANAATTYLAKNYTGFSSGYPYVSSIEGSADIEGYLGGGAWDGISVSTVSVSISRVQGTADFGSTGFNPGNAIGFGPQTTGGDNTYRFTFTFAQATDFFMDLGGGLGIDTDPLDGGQIYLSNFTIAPSSVVLRDVNGQNGVDLMWDGTRLDGTGYGNHSPSYYDDPERRASGTLEWNDITTVSFEYIIDDTGQFQNFSGGGFGVGRFGIIPATVPEPSGALLLATIGTFVCARRRRRRPDPVFRP